MMEFASLTACLGSLSCLTIDIANKTCVFWPDATQLSTFLSGGHEATEKRNRILIFYLGIRDRCSSIRIAEPVWPCICYRGCQAVDLRILSAMVYWRPN